MTGVQTCALPISIDGLLYSTTSMKEDMYSLPNTGMLKRAENDFKVNFKGGFFIGNKIYDLKAGEAAGSTPILIKVNKFEETLDKLNTFANRELKQKTKIYYNLLEFAETLP